MNPYYDFYKSHGICVTCGQEKAKPGQVRCWRCAIKQAEHEAEYRSRKTDEQKATALAERREKAAILREERRRNGLCPNCGRERTDTRYSLCERCRQNAKKSAERKRRDEGIIPAFMRGDGTFCAICLKPVETDGNKLCDRCYESCAVNVRKARAAQNNEDHPWRRLANGQYKLYLERKKKMKYFKEEKQ